MSRLFIALEPPVEIKKQLLHLRRACPGARWQTTEQMHLTLVFIGELNKNRIPELLETLSQVTAEPLTLRLKGVDYFGSSRYPRILFADMEDNPALHKLYSQLYKAVAAMGLALENRKYRPHITLARLERTPYPAIAEFLQHEALFKTDSFTLDQFHLFSSKQTNAGSEYRIEASFPLLCADGV